MIDIIVPVYNGFDYLAPLLQSILRHTDLRANRLLLVEDSSPDERVRPFLREFIAGAGRGLNIEMLENERNLGFVGSCNRGMKHSAENDVILLNSDTEVTPRWLGKIAAAAARRPEIATVTPLTNNGTITSVPEFCRDNELPADLSLDAYADLIEQTSLHIYPEMPTGHGYCMFIAREALRVVGFFDEATFKKGYGEENDFCYRAIELGFVNILCDDTFIYHKGTQSFTEDKKNDSIKEATAVLERRYPALRSYTSHYVVYKHNLVIQKNVAWQLMLGNRKNILFVAHTWIENEDEIRCVGGATLHVWDLMRNLGGEYNAFVFYSKKEGYGLSVYTPQGKRDFTFPMRVFYDVKYHNGPYSDLLRQILTQFDIDLVHIHHTAGHTLDIAKIAKEQGLPVVYTIHDFYSFCLFINCVNPLEKYCEPTCENVGNCAGCLSHYRGIGHNIAPRYREVMGEMLALCDVILSPADATATIVREIYPFLSPVTVPHGLDSSDYRAGGPAQPRGEAFHIAFIGGVAVHKGSHRIAALIKNCAGKKVRFTVFGAVYDEEIKKLADKNPAVTLIENYERADIVAMLQEHAVDLVGLFSIWPEAFSYTLTEAMMAGVPVLTFDTGALGERVRESGSGFLLPLGCSDRDVARKVDELMQHRDELAKTAAHLKTLKLKTTAEMGADHLRIYAPLAGEKHRNLHDRAFFERLLSDRASAADQMLMYQLFAAEEELRTLRSSLKYRVVNAIRFPPKFGIAVRRWGRGAARLLGRKG